MNYLATIAHNKDCTHLAWNAEARNTRGLNFYHYLGANIIKQEENRFSVDSSNKLNCN